MANTAIYPGSFDPFTFGHLDIVKKSARLFDRVYIVLGVNTAKDRCFDCEGMKTAIEETLRMEGLTNCEVCLHDGLVAVFAAERSIGYMIRGLRNSLDYNYEENIAEVNNLINPDLEYVYFRAENVAVSSSMVRELLTFDQDVSKYVPQPVIAMLESSKA